MREHSFEEKEASVHEIPEILSMRGVLGGIAHDHFFRAKWNEKKKKQLRKKFICVRSKPNT